MTLGVTLVLNTGGHVEEQALFWGERDPQIRPENPGLGALNESRVLLQIPPENVTSASRWEDPPHQRTTEYSSLSPYKPLSGTLSETSVSYPHRRRGTGELRRCRPQVGPLSDPTILSPRTRGRGRLGSWGLGRSLSWVRGLLLGGSGRPCWSVGYRRVWVWGSGTESKSIQFSNLISCLVVSQSVGSETSICLDPSSR